MIRFEFPKFFGYSLGTLLTLLESTPMAKASNFEIICEHGSWIIKITPFYLKGHFEYLGVKVINSSELRNTKHDFEKMKVNGKVN
jgi:hypothetical protein